MTSNTIFIFLLLLFVFGGIGIFVTNRKKEKNEKRHSWIKYSVYFLIVNTLFASIIYCPTLFSIFCILIVLGGGFELIRLQYQLTGHGFGMILLAYIPVSVLFCFFGFVEQNILSFTLLIVCSFDAFSQLSGQLLGKRKICPKISPEKTIGGTVGGTIISITVCVIAGCTMKWDVIFSSIIGLGIAVVSFAGDLSASYVKRQAGVKDFGRAFPGHGGFLDRFDSLILAGAFMYLFQLCCRL